MLKKINNQIRRHLLPRLIATVGQWALKCILRTCRFEVQGLNNLLDTTIKNRCMLMFWHNRITIIPFFIKKYAPQFRYGAVISNSRDGDLLDAIVKTHPEATSIRVPHSSRHQGLREMIRQLKSGAIILITPDGPRGPKYWVKPGVAYAAKATSSKIIPLSWSTNRYWQLKTWDKMIIPKPFSKIIINIGTNITIGNDKENKFNNEANKLKKILTNLDHQVCTKITGEMDSWPK